MSQTDYRPEQMWAGDIITACLPPRFQILYEYELTRLKEVQGIKKTFAKPDIVLLDEARNQRIAIRLNGPPHFKKLQKIKDADQKIVLEGNGWKVLDFDYDKMPNLWTNNREDKATRIGATKEVLEAIQFIWE